MPSIQPCDLPPRALLAKYQLAGAYTDCYVTEFATPVSHAEYVEAFYTTPLFRIERVLLALLMAKPSTDAQAHQLATGTAEAFAAWTVEGRSEDQLLLCDFQGRTRSWLMVATREGSAGTRLYFGSAVVPLVDASGNRRMGMAFRLLLGFHKLYSRALLFSARSRLAWRRATR